MSVNQFIVKGIVLGKCDVCLLLAEEKMDAWYK